jgi:CHAT domain-containing protein
VLLLLIPLQDTNPRSAQAAYEHAQALFQHGDLASSQWEAEQEASRFLNADPAWASKFQLLEAESMLFRGMYAETLRFLGGYHPSANDPEATIKKLAIEAVALTRQRMAPMASQRLMQAEVLCKDRAYAACGDVLRASGILAVEQGRFIEARRFFLEAFSFAQSHHNRLLEANAALNLGWVALQVDRYDEAVDWSRAAFRAAVELGAENTVQGATGNLGWAFYQLGDSERALEQFLEAEKSAERLGNVRYQLKWLSTAGYIYRDSGDWAHASDSYRRALYLAQQIRSKEDIVNALEDLARVSVLSGMFDDARTYIDQLTFMEDASASRPSAYLLLTEGMLAASLHQDNKAEDCFRGIQNDSSSQLTTRLIAGSELARLLESQNHFEAAEQMYKATLTAYESARATLKSEESQLPFGANATRIYDSYIHLLMQEGRTDAALATADQSRARTLEQRLGIAAGRRSFQSAALNPRQIAQRTDSTLLFYWLGEKQSYLWAITPSKVAAFTLPAQQEIVARIERYRKTILDLRDPRETADREGQALYQSLLAPAIGLIRPEKPVVVLVDGALSELNFETLLAPGPGPDSRPNSDTHAAVHYLLDDLTLVSAPSLAMLAAPQRVHDRGQRLLLLGNPISPSQDYPSLPLFGFEMTQVASHFGKEQTAVFAGQQATPAAYLSSNPAQYSYIHFVSHAIANRTNPLDSAIVLSRSAADENSFKLYARDIIDHPIDARLVTISACYGSGMRSYAGEGLVGLSWAFLRAGAQRVIGALWEVSDNSTPRLMDALYRSLEDGDSPAVSLRKAKLALLHSQGGYRLPYYWAPFQMYDRQ